MEPPLTVYLAQLIHSETRKMNLVSKMSHLGLSVSPDRMLDISTKMGNKAITVFEQEGVVCPLNLKYCLFTTAAMDNLDVNPSSSTAESSFHGTATSLNQHFCDDHSGYTRNIPNELPCGTAPLKNLPINYINVRPAYLPSKVSTPQFEESQGINDSAIELSQDCVSADQEWLEYVRKIESASDV